MSVLTVRPATPADFAALRPMLLDMGFVEDKEALAARFPAFCRREDFALLVAEDEAGELLGYAAVHDHGPHLRSGDSHRTAKLDDLYTVPQARRRGVARLLLRAVEDWARPAPALRLLVRERARCGARLRADGLPFCGRGTGGLPLLRDRPCR